MTHAKNLPLILIVLGLLVSLMSFTPSDNFQTQSEVTHSSEVTTQEDNLLPVIAWFSKRDTMTYWIHENEWKVEDQDTVMTLGVGAKVMLTVTDSTKKGYNMEYTFLEFISSKEIESEIQNFVGETIDILNDAAVGTSIKFRTDEYGKIIKYDNLKEIKKQAKSVLERAIQKMPYIDSLRAVGYDPSEIISKIDTDELIDGYKEELELLFNYHGGQYQIGEATNHSDATNTEYASDTKTNIWLNPETYEYGISADAYTYIPKEDIKGLLGNFIESYVDKDNAKVLQEDFNSNFDNQVTTDGVHNSFISITYFSDGWPQEVISQENTTLVNRKKLKQKYITWDYRSVGHSN